MKAFTDLSQSKVLAEFLPEESADHYHIIGHLHTDGPRYEVIRHRNEVSEPNRYWPCWSLAALFNIIPCAIHKSDNEFYRLGIDKGHNDYAVWYSNNGITINDLDVTSDNFVDACYEMILKLNELNLL